MNFMKKSSTQKRMLSRTVSHRMTKGLLAAAVVTGVAGISHQAALAQALLQQQGTLAPMEDAYSFEGVADQVMTIELKSDDFDTMLVLKGPNGEVLTSNDDYGGTLNSTIVLALPTSGSYSAVASSFTGSGGSYQIEVRPASEYEQAFSRAYDLSISEDYEGSIAAYTKAIELNDTDPSAYLGRAQARISRAYLPTETGGASPDELPKEVTDLVVADFLKAADLLEQQGQTEPAESLREQARYFSGEMSVPDANEPMPEPTTDDGAMTPQAPLRRMMPATPQAPVVPTTPSTAPVPAPAQ
jgi:tetratricopeptide (TPR) repeat protein